jgi:predicted nucleic acid-binding protein
MRPNVVVDASVLVSAFLFPASIPGQAPRAAERNAFAPHLSPIPIEETRRSLCNPRLRGTCGHTEGTTLD